jgi:hypothetical protein
MLQSNRGLQCYGQHKHKGAIGCEHRKQTGAGLDDESCQATLTASKP